MLSGMLAMCFGAPRFSVHVTTEHRLLALVINLFVGLFQTVSVLFCLVGWCWALGWGILLVKVAGKLQQPLNHRFQLSALFLIQTQRLLREMEKEQYEQPRRGPPDDDERAHFNYGR